MTAKRPSPHAIITALEKFMAAPTWVDSRRILEQHPELLSGEAEARLSNLVDAGRAKGREKIGPIFAECRDLLRRCREVGLDQAFAEKVEESGQSSKPYEIPPGVRPVLEGLVSLTQEQSKALLEIFAGVGQQEALEGAIAANPDVSAVLDQAIIAAAVQRRSDLIPPELRGFLEHAVAADRRYQRAGDPRALDEAVVAWRQMLKHAALATAHTSFRTAVRDAGANSLIRCYRARGQRADLDEAITLWEEAIAEPPDDAFTLAALFNNLGGGLRDRHLLTGYSADLEHAIEVYQGAVQHAPHQPQPFTGLGNALRDRYILTGNLAALERAIGFQEHAVQLALSDPPELAVCLNNLGQALHDRFVDRKELPDLARAIEAWVDAVRLTPADSYLLPTRLNNLGVGLRDRYGYERKLADLERAIADFDRAVRLASHASPELPMYLNNLGSSLHDRFVDRKELPDLARAIEAWEDAVRLTPADSPARPGRLAHLAGGLRDRYVRNRNANAADLKRATEAYRHAAVRGLEVAPEVALVRTRSWGDWAAERQAWAEAAEAYDYALKAMDRLFRTQLLRHDKEVWLREARGLPGRGAYALARTGHLNSAVESLERGRALLLSEALELDRADLERLKELGHTFLYERYRQAAHRWNQLARMDGGPKQAGIAGATLTEALEAARADLDAAISAIRRVPGYERFFEPLSFAHIQTSAEAAPLAYIVATEAGGLALIVHPRPAAVTAIWLPALTDKELRDHLQEYWGFYRLWGAAPRDDATREGWFAALDETTRWLWQVLMGPLVEALAPASRATLIPAGLLGLLPLHAAWTENLGAPTLRRYAQDTMTFTYTPNARALAAAEDIAVRTAPDALLAVDEPRPVCATPLPNSAREVETAVTTFPRNRVFRHEQATREAVLAALSEYAVLHFSCHGYANLAEPLAGGLVMANDELLSLRDLLDLRLPGARLAILSACETGIPGTELPDEVISLPTGFLQAGAGGVVASMWSVADISTMMLMTQFYYLWRGERMDPPEALRRAQGWLRDTTNGEKAAYLKALIPELARTRMASDTADVLYKGAIRSDPDARDFAHPFHWAAFSYVGV